MISKIEARMLGKTMRKSINSEQKIIKEKIIAKSVLSLPEVMFSSQICIYLPIGSEVDTKEIINELEKSGKTLYAPVTCGDDMYAVEYSKNKDTVIGNFGITEPIGQPCDKDKLDLVIVPLIAFNSTKDRVGYGKGYYDRFLPSKAITVGIAFSEQEFDFLAEEFDKKLDIIVTDKGVLR